MTTRTPAIRQTVGEARPRGVTEAPVAVPVRTAADVLRAAARYIEEHGWWGDEPDKAEPGKVCAWFAICAVGGEFDAIDRLAAFLGGSYPTSAETVFAFNDTPGRTEAEVLAALRLAAAAADGSAS